MITKAIIPVAGSGTRFLPLTKVLPKEFFQLGEKPLIQYAVQEAKAAGVQEIIFVVGQNKKLVVDYFRKSPRLEKFLEEKGKKDALEKVKELDRLIEGLTFSYVSQTKPLGDGHAVLQAKKLVGGEPCFVMFPDDVVDSKIPCVEQLAQIFKTSQKSIMALYQIPKERAPSYGIVDAEKIASRLYQINSVVEKPSVESAASNLAIIGRRIITPEVFDYLKKAKPNRAGEIVLTEAFGEMIRDGNMVYGYEVDGEWLECGDQEGLMRSNVYIALKHPSFGKKTQEFVKKKRLA